MTGRDPRPEKTRDYRRTGRVVRKAAARLLLAADEARAVRPETEPHTGQHGRHCMACAAYLRQCLDCLRWHMTTAQRDAHMKKEHGS